VIICLGEYFYDTDNYIVAYFNSGLVLGYIAFYVYEIFRTREYRLFIFSLGALLLIFVLGAWFISDLSIANVQI
jgi:hypothetical protein